MSIITLTTDFGYKDHYAGAVKGSILKQYPEAQIVDITHGVSNHNVVEAAFILRNCFFEYPEGSIHIIGVKTELDKEVDHVIVQYKNHFFVGADNGFFALLCEEPVQKVVRLAVRTESDNKTFASKDLLTKAACHLARGGTMEVIGQPYEGLTDKDDIKPVITEDSIRGMVIYIDSYGNAITNISKSLFIEHGKGRAFSINTKVRGYSMNKIREQYNDVAPGERLSIFNSVGLLEIAINVGDTSKLMHLRFSDVVEIKFEN